MAKFIKPARTAKAPKRLTSRSFESEPEFAIVDRRIETYVGMICRFLSNYIGTANGKLPENPEFRGRMLSAQGIYVLAIEGLSDKQKKYFNEKLCRVYKEKEFYSLPKETLDVLIDNRDVTRDSLREAKEMLAKRRKPGESSKEDTKEFFERLAKDKNATPEKVVEEAQKGIENFFDGLDASKPN